MCTENTPSSASTASGMRSRCRSADIDQHHRRHGDAVGGQVGHRGGVELDVGDRGERRRQRGRGGRRARGAPLVGAGAAAARSATAALTGNSQTAAAREFSVYAVVGAAPVS